MFVGNCFEKIRSIITAINLTFIRFYIKFMKKFILLKMFAISNNVFEGILLKDALGSGIIPVLMVLVLQKDLGLTVSIISYLFNIIS